MYLIFTILLGIVVADKSNEYQQKYDEVRSVSPTSILITEEDVQFYENEVKYEEESTIKKSRGSSFFNTKEDHNDGAYDGKWVDTIPGEAGKDFPSYSEIPKTSFSCKGRRLSGYYADIETDCQVFHICVAAGQKISFLCPNGSIFNQKVLVCDWWYDVDCRISNEVAELSEEVLKSQEYHQQQLQEVANFEGYVAIDPNLEYDLNLASSGGNEHPKFETLNSSEDVKDNVKKEDGEKVNTRYGKSRKSSQHKSES